MLQISLNKKQTAMILANIFIEDWFILKKNNAFGIWIVTTIPKSYEMLSFSFIETWVTFLICILIDIIILLVLIQSRGLWGAGGLIP